MTQILVGSINKKCIAPPVDDAQSEKECDSNLDIINNLPECIMEKILQYLPIKEAVRTCILSKNWRRTWCNLQDLYIDFNNQGSNHHQMMDLNRIGFVDHVLNLHNGNVRILKISGVISGPEDFKRWMLKLSNMQIEELILELDCKRRRKWLSCQHTGLCAFKIADGFDGFKRLRSLHLYGECKINEIDMAKLISSCPLLEELNLHDFSYSVLQIHALNLRKMSIWGNFGDLYLQTPKLLKFSVGSTCLMTFATREVIFGRNIIQALSCVSHIQYLSIYMQRPDPVLGSLPAKISPTLCNLTNLFVHLRPSDAEMTMTLFLFRNTPNLQQLTLAFQPYLSLPIPSTYEQLESREQRLFSKLRTVSIILNPGSDCAISLAKFILNNAHALEEVTVWDNVKDLKDSQSCELRGLAVTAKIILRKLGYNSRGEIKLY